MIGAGSNHCRIVAESLTDGRDVDEQTLASVAVLGERLERLKGLDEAFSDITLSDAVQELQSRKKAVTVG